MTDALSVTAATVALCDWTPPRSHPFGEKRGQTGDRGGGLICLGVNRGQFQVSHWVPMPSPAFKKRHEECHHRVEETSAAAATMHDETTRAKKQSKMRAGAPYPLPLPPCWEGGREGGAGARNAAAAAAAAAREEEKGMTHQ